MKGILFLCVANSARSQMAEGIARSMAPEGVTVWSAGSRPTQVRPEAEAVLEEIGIDISAHRSKAVAEIPASEVDTVITLCGEEECPLFPDAVKELVAIGASIAPNCEMCFKNHFNEARKLGVSKEDVRKAGRFARRRAPPAPRVRHGRLHAVQAHEAGDGAGAELWRHDGFVDYATLSSAVRERLGTTTSGTCAPNKEKCEP